MKRLLIASALALAAVAMSACAGMPGITQGATTKDFLDHMETCNRHYTGTIAATGINGSLDIQCPAIIPAGSVLAPAPAAGGVIQSVAPPTAATAPAKP